MDARRIDEVAAASPENRHLPSLLDFGFGDGLHIGLHSAPDQLSNGPVPGAGNALDLMKERLWKLDLSSRHAINIMLASFCCQVHNRGRYRLNHRWD